MIGNLRFRSILTVSKFLLLVSNSNQAPRPGISLAAKSLRPVVASSSAVKYTPGERTSWLTTTRSAPLIMKVPSLVIRGKSPIKMSFSIISPVSLLMRRALTLSGAEYVASRSRHSSSLYLGLPNGSGGTINSRLRFLPVKSSIGEISSKSSRRPSFLNHSKESS